MRLPPLVVAPTDGLAASLGERGFATISVPSLLAEPEDSVAAARARVARIVMSGAGILYYRPTVLGAEPSDRLAASELRIRQFASEVEALPGDQSAADAARHAAYPRLDAAQAAGLGSPRPAIVLVGGARPRRGLPFSTSSGAHLMSAIRSIGHDELGVFFAAADPLGYTYARLREFLSAVVRRPTVVAVDHLATAYLVKSGISFIRAPSPAWHMRFRSRNGVRGYADALLAVGVPAGPGVSEAADWPGAEMRAPELFGAVLNGNGRVSVAC